jgi:hypothetical protein
MLPLPDFLEHPFGEISKREQPWYVLLIPTHEEGEDVRDIVPRLLEKHDERFTLIFAVHENDVTIPALKEAQRRDDRIEYVVVQGEEVEALETALVNELLRQEAERGRKATDALVVPLTMLSVHSRFGGAST